MLGRTNGVPVFEDSSSPYRAGYPFQSGLPDGELAMTFLPCFFDAVDTAAIRYVHLTTPIIEWLVPDRIFKQGTAVNPSIGNKSGKHQHCQQEAAADNIRGCFSDRYPVPTQPSAAALAAVTPIRLLHPLRSPYPRRS